MRRHWFKIPLIVTTSLLLGGLASRTLQTREIHVVRIHASDKSVGCVADVAAEIYGIQPERGPAFLHGKVDLACEETIEARPTLFVFCVCT